MDSFQHFMHSFWIAITPLELVIFSCALLYALFASYEKVWCWPFGILYAGLFMYSLLLEKGKMQAALQFVYLVMSIYGWYEWVYGKRDNAPLHVVSFSRKELLISFLVGIPLTIGGALLNAHYNTDMPWLDSALTIYSLIGTWLMAKKALQNWIFWMVIDPLYIWFFAARGRYLIAFLFLIYTLIAVFGYMKWKEQLRKQTAVA